MSVEALPSYLKEHWPGIRTQRAEGSYCPQAVRHLEIAKSDGRNRWLSIPTALDRFIQHATAQVESGRWEPHFHPRSDELRRRCSAHESCVAVVNPHAAATAPKSTIVFTDHLRELGHIEGQNSKLRSPRYEEERKDHRLGIHSRNSLVCRLHLWTEGKRSRMAKPNYAFAKRQRDLAKKTKKEEKRLRKTGKTETPPQDTQPAPTGADNTVA